MHWKISRVKGCQLKTVMMITDIKMSTLKVTVCSQSCLTIASDIEEPYFHFSPFSLILFMDNYPVSSTYSESYTSGLLSIYF